MLKGKGFLGTGATFGADLNLLLFLLLLVPLMLIGFRYARRKRFQSHKYVMTAVTLLNWVLIALIMVVSYNDNVRPGLPDHLKHAFFLDPTVHALVALTAQFLATFLVIRMWFEKRLPKRLLVQNFKPWMRLTLGLWLVSATLGVVTYDEWYLNPSKVVVPAPGADGTTLVVLQNFAFNPKQLTVVVGTTVTWVNRDPGPHTVTFDDGSVDSKQLQQNDTFSHTFDKVGTYPLYCTLHGAPGGAGMSMTVTVVESSKALTAEPPQAATATPTPASTSSEVVVTIQNFAFSPNPLMIPVGTAVRFVNKDALAHTVTADDGSFDSGTLNQGQDFTFTFTKAGTFAYYCAFHGGKGGVGMSGTIMVK